MEMCFGQRIDPELGILEPWYTNPAMDVIKTWNLSDKVVWEYGAGASTLWWAKKASFVVSMDHSDEWFDIVKSMFIGLEGKNNLIKVDTHEGDQSERRDQYVRMCDHLIKPDIVIVDGIHRFECAEYAMKVLHPEILIIDNHQQDYVFMCPSLDELMKGVKMERFIQPDHTDHQGNPWATAIFYLNEH